MRLRWSSFHYAFVGAAAGIIGRGVGLGRGAGGGGSGCFSDDEGGSFGGFCRVEEVGVGWFDGGEGGVLVAGGVDAGLVVGSFDGRFVISVGLVGCLHRCVEIDAVPGKVDSRVHLDFVERAKEFTHSIIIQLFRPIVHLLSTQSSLILDPVIDRTSSDKGIILISTASPDRHNYMRPRIQIVVLRLRL